MYFIVGSLSNMELDIDEMPDNSHHKKYSSELATQGMYIIYDLIMFHTIINLKILFLFR